MQSCWREGKALDPKVKGHLRGGASERRPKPGKSSPVETGGGFRQKEELCKAPRAEVSLVMKEKSQGRVGRARSCRAWTRSRAVDLILSVLGGPRGRGAGEGAAERGRAWLCWRESTMGKDCSESRRGPAQSRHWRFGRQRGDVVRKRGLRFSPKTTQAAKSRLTLR